MRFRLLPPLAFLGATALIAQEKDLSVQLASQTFQSHNTIRPDLSGAVATNSSAMGLAFRLNWDLPWTVARGKVRLTSTAGVTDQIRSQEVFYAPGGTIYSHDYITGKLSEIYLGQGFAAEWGRGVAWGLGAEWRAERLMRGREESDQVRPWARFYFVFKPDSGRVNVVLEAAHSLSQSTYPGGAGDDSVRLKAFAPKFQFLLGASFKL